MDSNEQFEPIVRNRVKWRLDHLPDDSELPDVLGDIDRSLDRLKDLRKMLLSEAPGPIEGVEYRLKQYSSASRSYNDSRLLADFAKAIYPRRKQPLADTLRTLIDEGAIRINWQWTATRRAAERHNVTLAITPREIGDGDPDAHIGEVWTTYLKPEPKRRR
jgi:hypothetical protein